jgi:hypothetical protein
LDEILFPSIPNGLADGGALRSKKDPHLQIGGKRLACFLLGD